MERNAEWIIQTMTAKGLRITEQRRKLANLFAKAPGFLTPREIFLEMEYEYPGLSFDTVYRNLRVLQELGVIEPFYLEDGVKFGIGSTLHSHHHHFICLDCNQMTEIELAFSPVDTVKLPDSYEMIRHRFEVYGYCMECKNQNHTGKTP